MSEDTYYPTAKGYAIYSAWLEATAKKHNCSIDEARALLRTQLAADVMKEGTTDEA